MSGPVLVGGTPERTPDDNQRLFGFGIAPCKRDGTSCVLLQMDAFELHLPVSTFLQMVQAMNQVAKEMIENEMLKRSIIAKAGGG